MVYSKNPELKSALYRHITNSLSKPRQGWHLSDFSSACNYKTYFRKTGQAPPTTRDQNMIFWMGHAAQFFLAPIRPEDAPSVEIDGILMTPDFADVSFDDYQCALAEMKSTRKSEKNFHPKDTPHYLLQIAGYCKAKGVTKADLIMYFIHGDYTQRPPVPTLDCWTLEFTQDEIDTMWKEILRRRDVLDFAMKNGTPPDPVIRLGDWECGYCECAEFCPHRIERKNGPKGAK